MRKVPVWVLLFLAIRLLSGCAPDQLSQGQIRVQIEVDGQTRDIQVSQGSTVEQALAAAQVALGPLDRSEPESYQVLADQALVRVIRVEETFEIRQEILPYERQTLYNESLADDQEMLVQKGQNGLREVTYRRVRENGAEISAQAAPVKSLLVKEPLPEIVMIGIQTSYRTVNLPGRLVFLRDGNVWMIEGSSANRRAVITTGDLDGRIFSLSDDGNWLLFTRKNEGDGQINHLWAAKLNSNENAQLVDLKIANVVHFADFRPGTSTRVVYSTVEPRPAAPGWQANNDLFELVFSHNGWLSKARPLLDANTGGIYGWWGMDFAWVSGGARMAYTRPDGIGLLDLEQGTLTETLAITPLSTRGDWAWTPGLAWATDGSALIGVDHPSPPGSLLPEESQQFDLVMVNLDTQEQRSLVANSGMFAYPLSAPANIFTAPDGDAQLPNASTPAQATTPVSSGAQIAFLQALFPEQSESSGYQVMVINQDGSSLRPLFPGREAESLEPQKHWGAWSPQPLVESQAYALAVLYQGNLWLVDVQSGEATQLTGDHLTYRVAWKNIQN